MKTATIFIIGAIIGITVFLGHQRLMYRHYVVPYIKYDQKWYVCEWYKYPDGNMVGNIVLPTSHCRNI